ncbi:acyltransferase family protein [Collimonas fungivorans]|uniref:Putative acyltransferase n=1 Tax=Collimonas fungivorans (strain Ter331) TaxID=1005048 RepID=G0AJ13_COLFT|nr:acyltransferase [Collimonas fungivorans]AEK60946.1 putative acyltransferase [Collimonas fungivorans Ter331]
MNHRIKDIELLRGIAVLFVLFEHTRFNLIGQPSEVLDYVYRHFGFWTGVDLFFAISGFVIARDLIPRLNRSASRQEFFAVAAKFWIRRAWRLWPSAWLWLALLLLAAVAFRKSGIFGSLQANLDGSLAGILNYANFRLAFKFGREELGPAFPYWSLSLEEQFYLLLPVVAFICRRWISGVLIVLVALQFFASRHQSLLLMNTRSDALLLGVLLAIWSKHGSYRWLEPVFLKQHNWMRSVFLVILAAGLAVTGAEQHQDFRYWVGFVALLSIVLVWIASYDADYLMADNPAKRVLLWIGSRSYALYLTHMPAYLMSRQIWYWIAPMDTVFDQTYNARLVLTALVLLLAFSELNYRFIEVPLRARGKRIVDQMGKPQFQFQT